MNAAETLNMLNAELRRLDPGGAVANEEGGQVRVADGNGESVVDAARALEAIRALPDDCAHESLWEALRTAEVDCLL